MSWPYRDISWSLLVKGWVQVIYVLSIMIYEIVPKNIGDR